MTDTSLLDGTVEDVKTGLTGLDANTLGLLLAAEQAGKTRKGVIDAIEAAQAASSAVGVSYSATTDRGDGSDATIVSDVGAPAAAITTAASLDRSADANIAPATEFEASGAPIQTSPFDLDSMALDANPRARTTEDQNRIDFNDPVKTGEEIVTARLKDQASA